MEAVLEIRNATKKYEGFCLNGINLTLPKGCIMGLIGENGAGKTTTIKAILGMLVLDMGNITILGQDVSKNIRKMKEHIGVVLSDCMFPENMKILEIDRVMKQIYHNWNHDSYMSYVKQFQLPINKVIKQFSRGMKMKLNIAIALSHDAKLLILDEATSGLDPVIRDEILELLMNFIQDEERSILISSHITSDIEKCCDYVTYLHEGTIVLSDEKDKILESYGILRTDAQSFLNLDKDDYLSYQKTAFSLNVLIRDKTKVLKKLPHAVIDKASLEEIMLMMVKGEK